MFPQAYCYFCIWTQRADPFPASSAQEACCRCRPCPQKAAFQQTSLWWGNGRWCRWTGLDGSGAWQHLPESPRNKYRHVRWKFIKIFFHLMFFLLLWVFYLLEVLLFFLGVGVVKAHDKLAFKCDLVVLVEQSGLGVTDMQVSGNRETEKSWNIKRNYWTPAALISLLTTYNLNFSQTPCQALPAGLRGESDHHFAHLSSGQIHKLANILLLLIRLLPRDTNSQQYNRTTAFISYYSVIFWWVPVMSNEELVTININQYLKVIYNKNHYVILCLFSILSTHTPDQLWLASNRCSFSQQVISTYQIIC